MAPRTYTDTEIADVHASYTAKGYQHYGAVEMTCAETGVGPERVTLASARRLFGRA